MSDGLPDEGHGDHSCWERPADMDTPRTVYKVDPAHPGSDVATLATGSIVFREADPAHSKRLLDRAVSVFEQVPVRAAAPHARPTRPREHAHLLLF